MVLLHSAGFSCQMTSFSQATKSQLPSSSGPACLCPVFSLDGPSRVVLSRSALILLFTRLNSVSRTRQPLRSGSLPRALRAQESHQPCAVSAALKQSNSPMGRFLMPSSPSFHFVSSGPNRTGRGEVGFSFITSQPLKGQQGQIISAQGARWSCIYLGAEAAGTQH